MLLRFWNYAVKLILTHHFSGMLFKLKHKNSNDSKGSSRHQYLTIIKTCLKRTASPKTLHRESVVIQRSAIMPGTQNPRAMPCSRKLSLQLQLAPTRTSHCCLLMEKCHCSINTLIHATCPPCLSAVKCDSLSDFAYHLQDTLQEFLKINTK